ncbi:hypothetical protein, partial [Bacillus mobilis]|uniref:hypothetical protein n=1 Tax=Bacillus mobilis TaxID=2026190 RepID=UPI00363E2D81
MKGGTGEGSSVWNVACCFWLEPVVEDARGQEYFQGFSEECLDGSSFEFCSVVVPPAESGESEADGLKVVVPSGSFARGDFEQEQQGRVAAKIMPAAVRQGAGQLFRIKFQPWPGRP